MAVAASSPSSAHDLLLPPPAGGLLRGAGLALLAHALLFMALTSAVQWRASPPEAVTAELWSAVPQVAAPRAVETPAPAPPPAPPAPLPKVEPKAEPTLPDPQIAIAKAEKERVDRDRRERERLDKERADKKERDAAEAAHKKQEQLKVQAAQAAKQKAEDERLAKQRDDNLKRMMGQAGATGSAESSGTAARDAGPSKSYAGKLVATIKPNIVFTDQVSGNAAAEVEVSAAPSGSILARRLVRSSGNKDWDEAVLRAIDRTGSLPRDTDGRVPSRIIVAFRPQE
jgi:colicin import membrane protein